MGLAAFPQTSSSALRHAGRVVHMDVPLVLDPQQLRRDALSGKVSVEGLLDIIDRQRHSIQRLQADNQRLKQRLAQYEPAAARDNPASGANAATPNASYSIDAENKRRQPRRRRKKKWPGRQPTEVKFAAAERQVDIFPDGVAKRQCQLVREREVWRMKTARRFASATASTPALTAKNHAFPASRHAASTASRSWWCWRSWFTSSACRSTRRAR